jgi:hypothetical protein
MTTSSVARAGAQAPQTYSADGRAHEPANLGDILERVLDKGLVIAGDIQVNLLDIELLTIKLRLVIASLDTAREVGINWWENDPWMHAPRTSAANPHSELDRENRRLRQRIVELEAAGEDIGNRGR